MTNAGSVYRILKRDRTYVYRLFSFLLFVGLQIVSIVILHGQSNGRLHFLELANLIVGTFIAISFVVGAVEMTSRTLRHQKTRLENVEIQTKYISTREFLFRIDSQTREEVGAWLHGSMQPQLTRLAKEINTRKETDLDSISQKIDELNEKFVRTYSHSLFPPALMVSLEVGLETLLEGRAELVLDARLTNAANFGFSIWSPESELKTVGDPLRLHLGRERSYAAYRIVEEAVANAERKPSTTRIVVDIRVENEILRILVHDDGSPIAKSAVQGLGLSVINAFVQKFDGTMSIDNVNNGVELIVNIPYSLETVADMLHKRFQGGLDE
jgi:signal transduction histidine kinase